MASARTLALTAALLVVVAAGFAVTAKGGSDSDSDGDWQMVTSPQEQPQSEQPQSAAPALAERPAASAPKAGVGPAIACGEEAVSASDQVKAVVAEINRVWHSGVKVYQSVQPSGPHARPGGCIFYHPGVMAGLLKGWMNIKEAREEQPMVYAIFAHEIGHEVHGDFDSSRANLSSEERELEADRFAGYTMSFLRIQADDLTTYYRLVGDDFMGAQDSHGTGDQRATAFEYGWKLAEAGSSEQSIIPAAGLGHP